MIVATSAAALPAIVVLVLWHIYVTDALFFITHPTTTKDWQQLAALVVRTFDSPSSEASAAEKLAWNVVVLRSLGICLNTSLFQGTA